MTSTRPDRRHLLRGTAALAVMAGLHRAQAAQLPPLFLSDVNRVAAMAARRPQIIANRGQMPTGTYGNGTPSGRSDTRLEGRSKFTVGPFSASQVQFAFANYCVPSTGVGETVVGNPVTVEASLEKLASAPDPAACFAMTFGGAASATMASGARMVLTDPIPGVYLAGGSKAFARFGLTVSAGTMLYPYGTSPQGNGVDEFGSLSTAADSRVFGTGTPAVPSGGFGGLFGSVLAVIGVPSKPHPSVVILGNSIDHGSGETATTGDGNGNIGYVGRGLASVAWGGMAGVQIPYARTSQGGDLLAKNLGDGIRKRALWPYATHLILGDIRNDLAAGASLATMQSYLTAIWTAAKATTGPYGKALHVAQALTPPNTSSTDSWATAANQTASGAFVAGGIRDQLHAWIKAQVGQGLLDSVIDPNPYCEDPANPGKWITNGTANYPTTDGLHPSTAVHILMAQAVNAWAAGLTV